MNNQPLDNNKLNTHLKLYYYGTRQSDQFWVPNSNTSSVRKPMCLTDIQKFTFNNSQEDDQSGKMEQEDIPNPLFHVPIYKIACGSIHTIVLTTSGKVFTFGCNDQGALGRKGIQCIPIQVELQDPIDLIAAGDNHSLFANSHNGVVYFTGNYNFKRGEMMTKTIHTPQKGYIHEINITNKNKKIQKLSCGANHSCILVNNKIFCRGQPQASTTGRRISPRNKVESSLTFNGVLLSDVVDLQCGGYHTIAKIEKNGKYTYYGWGTNSHGQLGVGSFDDQEYPVQIKKLRDQNIVKMAAGASFSYFLNDKGEVFGCGNNQDCNLGVGEQFQETPEQNIHPINKDSNQQINEKMENLNIKPGQQVGAEIKEKKKNNYFTNIVKIPVPQPATNVAAGENFGFAWNKSSLYTWGMGYGYVLLNGEENDEPVPFKVKSKIINEHTIFELDAGTQHVVYTSHPSNIENITVEPLPCVYQNLTIKKKK